MRFLVDAQLPPALARMPAANGLDAGHVHEVGLGGAEDSAIWDHAARTGAAIITKDEDFVSLSTLPRSGLFYTIRYGQTDYSNANPAARQALAPPSRLFRFV